MIDITYYFYYYLLSSVFKINSELHKLTKLLGNCFINDTLFNQMNRKINQEIKSLNDWYMSNY